jgi:hypothetical protein
MSHTYTIPDSIKTVINSKAETIPFSAKSLEKTIQFLSEDLNHDHLDTPDLIQKIINGLHNDIKAESIYELAAETAAFMTINHPDYSILAGRLAIKSLHKRTSGSFYQTMSALYNYKSNGRDAPMIEKAVFEVIEANQALIQAKIDYAKDFTYDFSAVHTLGTFFCH